MAAAGYDPRAMASMFKTIEMEGGSGGPQWLSDHPNPGARSEYITREAQLLDVRNSGTGHARVRPNPGATGPNGARADDRSGHP